MNKNGNNNPTLAKETQEANWVIRHDKEFKEKLKNPIYRIKMNNFVHILKEIWIEKGLL